MHLLTLIFGILLLPKAYTLKCYGCTRGSSGACIATEKQCSLPVYQCGAMRIVSYAGDSKLSDMHMKICAMPEQCIEGSVNFGLARTVITSQCCTSELCNNQPAPEARKSDPNGKKCYYCDGLKCTSTLNCVGDEDHCISQKVTKGGEKKIAKGCASKQMCSHMGNAEITAFIGGEIICCQGDLCNSASSTSAGLLLLVAQLVSLVMFS